MSSRPGTRICSQVVLELTLTAPRVSSSIGGLERRSGRKWRLDWLVTLTLENPRSHLLSIRSSSEHSGKLLPAPSTGTRPRSVTSLPAPGTGPLPFSSARAHPEQLNPSENSAVVPFCRNLRIRSNPKWTANEPISSFAKRKDGTSPGKCKVRPETQRFRYTPTDRSWRILNLASCACPLRTRSAESRRYL